MCGGGQPFARGVLQREFLFCAGREEELMELGEQDQISEFDSGTIPSPLKDLLPPHTEASLSVSRPT